MKFISASEFLTQDEEIQKIFIDWWKPEVGDIFSTKAMCDEIDVVVDADEKNIFSAGDTFRYNLWTGVDKELEPFPLLTEGQIRQFILDKTGCKVIELFSNIDTQEFQACIYDSMFSAAASYEYTDLGNDMFKAYWKIALKLLESEVEINE